MFELELLPVMKRLVVLTEKYLTDSDWIRWAADVNISAYILMSSRPCSGNKHQLKVKTIIFCLTLSYFPAAPRPSALSVLWLYMYYRFLSSIFFIFNLKQSKLTNNSVCCVLSICCSRWLDLTPLSQTHKNHQRTTFSSQIFGNSLYIKVHEHWLKRVEIIGSNGKNARYEQFPVLPNYFLKCLIYSKLIKTIILTKIQNATSRVLSRFWFSDLSFLPDMTHTRKWTRNYQYKHSDKVSRCWSKECGLQTINTIPPHFGLVPSL